MLKYIIAILFTLLASTGHAATLPVSQVTTKRLNTAVFTSGYASLNAAHAAAAAVTGGVLIGDADKALTSSLTMTVPYTWQGGLISCGSYTMSISNMTAGNSQVFDSTCGAGYVTGLTEARPEWWGTGDGDDTDAFESAQAAVNTGSTVYIHDGDYILNEWNPRSSITYIGSGGKSSRLTSSTSDIIKLTASREYVTLAGLGFSTTSSFAAINTDGNSAGHFAIRDCNFEGPSKYGLQGYFILSLIENNSFGYYPSNQKMETGIYFDTAANQNLIQFNKFYRMTAPAIMIRGHGYNNAFNYNDFETLDNIVADIEQGDSTRFEGNWAENINIISNADNCVIKFGSGNTSMNVVDNFRLAGNAYNTDKFFLIGSYQPKIKFINSFIGSNYTGLSVISLTANDSFWYQGNRDEGAVVTITDNGYRYYGDFSGYDETASLSVIGLLGTAVSGTWTRTYDADYLPSLARDAANNTEHFHVIEIPVSMVTTTSYGIMPTSVTMVYNITNSDPGDDIGITVRTRTAPSDGSAPSIPSNLSMSYDSNHDTAAKRSNSDGSTHENHVLTKTFDNPAWLNSSSAISIVTRVMETNNAASALSVTIKDIIFHYTKR